MDRLASMAVFVAVAKAGSLSAAGRKLGMPLATVSRRLADLEAHLQARLLSRSTRQLALTDAGRGYLAACQRILQDVDDAQRAASGEYSAPKGDLMVAAPIVFGRLHVLPVVTAFLEAFPQVDVRLVLSDRVANLLEDHLDLAVRIGELPDSSLSAARVGTTQRVVCASPAYLAERGVPRAPGELGAHRCVTFDALMSPHTWSFRVGGAELPVAVHSRLVVNTAEAAVDAAIAGVGLTRVLSYQIEPATRAGSLVAVLREFEPPAIPVSLVYSRQGQLPLKLRAFLDFAAPRLRERLPAQA